MNMTKLTPRQQYLKLIDEKISEVSISLVIDWVNDFNRKPAIFSFTEGSARQLAYAIERMIKLEKETTPTVEPLKLSPTEKCPRCGFTEIAKALSQPNEPYIYEVVDADDTYYTKDKPTYKGFYFVNPLFKTLPNTLDLEQTNKVLEAKVKELETELNESEVLYDDLTNDYILVRDNRNELTAKLEKMREALVEISYSHDGYANKKAKQALEGCK